MALAISLLSLWTSVGGGIGSAIAAAIWNSKLPANLDKYLGDQLNSTEIADIYGSIIVARLAEPRDLVIRGTHQIVDEQLLLTLNFRSVRRHSVSAVSSCSLPVRRSPHCRVSNDQFLSWNYAQRDRGQGNTPAPW
jgi:hypothetical protein